MLVRILIALILIALNGLVPQLFVFHQLLCPLAAVVESDVDDSAEVAQPPRHSLHPIGDLGWRHFKFQVFVYHPQRFLRRNLGQLHGAELLVQCAKNLGVSFGAVPPKAHVILVQFGPPQVSAEMWPVGLCERSQHLLDFRALLQVLVFFSDLQLVF